MGPNSRFLSVPSAAFGDLGDFPGLSSVGSRRFALSVVGVCVVVSPWIFAFVFFLLCVTGFLSLASKFLFFCLTNRSKSLSICPSLCLSTACVASRARRPPTSALPCLALGLAVGCLSGPPSGQRLSDGELLLECLSSERLAWSRSALCFSAISRFPSPLWRWFSGVSCVKEHLSLNLQGPSM